MLRKNGLYRVYRVSFNGRCKYYGESINKYAKASRIIEVLDTLQIIGEFNGSKARELLIEDIEEAKNILNNNLSNKDILDL